MQEDWARRTRAYLKREMKRRRITYKDLAEQLSKTGLVETERSINQKINRGAFPAWFFVAALSAISCRSFSLDDL